MILEIADMRIQPGQGAAFEAAIEGAFASVVARAKGFRGGKVHKGIESPDRYVVMLWWDTLEDHTEGFRGGPLFAEWRAAIGPYFAQAPAVEHFTLVHETPR